MATRQPSCEIETVPSLHSNLGDAASATGGGFAGTAACWGAGACAAGFWKKAQPVHENAIDRARTNRTCAASGTAPAAGRLASWNQPVSLGLLQHITAEPDSDTHRRLRLW
jgi:hypothetical protein